MPTVALMCYFLGPKLGIGQYLDQLLPELVETLLKQNVNVVLVSSPNAVRMTPALQNLSAYVNLLPALDRSPSKRWIWILSQFRGYCKQNKIDIVVWLTNPIILPWHSPSIAVIHDVSEWKMAEKYGNRTHTILRSLLYLDCSLLFARKVIAISQFTANDIKKFRPYLQLNSKVSVIVNGSDSSLTRQVIDKIPMSEIPFLLSVGRIDPVGKRLVEAVKLTLLLREKSGEPWELHLVGGMNSTTQSTGEDFLDNINSIPWANYHGHVSDFELAQWFQKSSAVVFLSDYEGFGMPIAEASAFQRWTIVSKNNAAAIESGGKSVIAINLEMLEQEADKVLEYVSQNPVPPSSVPINSWKSAAEQYSQEMLKVLFNSK